MRIKTYNSDSVPKALKKIQKELGPGAVILKTNRTIKRRFLGLVPSLAYEITAAADTEATGLEGEPRPVPDAPGAKARSTPTRDGQPDSLRPSTRPIETYEIAQTPVTDRKRDVRLRANPERPAGKSQDEDWIKQFDKLNHEIRDLIRLVHQHNAFDAMRALLLRNDPASERLRDLIWGGNRNEPRLASALYSAFASLVEQGVEEEFALLLVQRAAQNLPCDEDLSTRIRVRLSRAISSMVSLEPFVPSPEKSACILLGPTGVGKTTTIAKLAARFALRDKKTVRLLTVDTYRVAAVEQLQAYGEIIGTPVSVVFSVDELDARLRKPDSAEITLIDTTGHSHRRISEYSSLAAYLCDNTRLEKHLVLSATTRQKDLRDIVTCFEAFRPDKLLFTKLDESSTFGALFNELVRTKKPLAYLTEGQAVAKDLVVPTQSTLPDLLIPIE
ncbi:MAG: flagellar biosynthesis protein FlhF [Acidobacteriota bacterium]